MNSAAQLIPLQNLAIAFVPVLAVLWVLKRWQLDPGTALYGLARMLGQLLLIGYLLIYLFAAETCMPVLAVLVLMLIASSWIGLRTLRSRRWQLLSQALLAIGLGAGSTLLVVILGVLEPAPWYNPQVIIPLAGMLFAGSMNAVALACDRLAAELDNGLSYPQARRIALKAALIPVINGLFAVGLVSLPGMMTGQILSGISPLVAVRYQILVMCMLFGATGLSACLFLTLVRSAFTNPLPTASESKS